MDYKSRNAEVFLWLNNKSPNLPTNPIAGAIEDYTCNSQKCWSMLHHGELHIDPIKAINELRIEYPWIKEPRLVYSNFYRSACEYMLNGGAVLFGEPIVAPIRDRYGFCRPTAQHSNSLVYLRGFTDNNGRPGVIVQSLTGYPKGPDKIVLPGGTKIVLPKASYLLDASVFDELLLATSMIVIPG